MQYQATAFYIRLHQSRGVRSAASAGGSVGPNTQRPVVRVKSKTEPLDSTRWDPQKVKQIVDARNIMFINLGTISVEKSAKRELTERRMT